MSKHRNRKKNRNRGKVQMETKDTTNRALQLVIPNDKFQQIMWWINKAPGECSGLGKLEVDGSRFTLVKVCLCKQENTGSSTDLDASAVAKAVFELKDEPGHLNFWWHSHANMDVFWSGTDHDTIQELGNHGWLVSTVFNKKREVKTAFYQKAADPLPRIFIDNIQTDVLTFLDKDHIAAWDKEYEEKCKPKAYVPPTYTYSGYTGADDWAKKRELKRAGLKTIKELDDMCQTMETTKDTKEAKDILTKILNSLQDLFSLTSMTYATKEELKEGYIIAYISAHKTDEKILTYKQIVKQLSEEIQTEFPIC